MRRNPELQSNITPLHATGKAHKEQTVYPYYSKNIAREYENPGYLVIAERIRQGEVLTIADIRTIFKAHGGSAELSFRFSYAVLSGRFKTTTKVDIYLELYDIGLETSGLLFYSWSQRESLKEKIEFVKKNHKGRGISALSAERLRSIIEAHTT